MSFALKIFSHLLIFSSLLFSEDLTKIKKGVTLIGGMQNQQFYIDSKFTKQKYLIQIFEPKTPPLEEGYHVVYILDGNATFPIASVLAQSMDSSSNKTNKIAPLIVAIGYEQEKLFDIKARSYDYTPPFKGELKIPENRANLQYEQGGANHFFKFIDEQLKPIIEKNYRVNKNNQTLFGHSFGGLFTLFTFLNYPNSFQNYIAASPSIWWNDFFILKEQKNIKLDFTNKTSLFLSVGELENKNKRIQTDLVDKNYDIEQFLSNLNKPKNFHSKIYKFEDASHIEALFYALNLIFKID